MGPGWKGAGPGGEPWGARGRWSRVRLAWVFGCCGGYCGDPASLLAPALPSDVEAIAKLITTFLELHRLESPGELSQSSDSEADGPSGQS